MRACIVFLALSALFASVFCQTVSLGATTSTYYAGFSYNIRWTSASLTADTNLTLTLLRNSGGLFGGGLTPIYTIADPIANSGSFTWNIPTSLSGEQINGADSVLRLCTKVNNICDDSSAFTIAFPSIDNVRILNTNVTVGAANTIFWSFATPANTTSGNVFITLMRQTNPETVIGNITNSFSARSNYTWVPAASLTLSADYFIRVTLIEYPVASNIIRTAAFTIRPNAPVAVSQSPPTTVPAPRAPTPLPAPTGGSSGVNSPASATSVGFAAVILAGLFAIVF